LAGLSLLALLLVTTPVAAADPAPSVDTGSQAAPTSAPTAPQVDDPAKLAAQRAAMQQMAVLGRLNPFADRILFGPGAVVSPDYPGAVGYRILPIPAADVRLGRFYFNGRDGAGFDLIKPKPNAVRVGVGLFFRPDRDTEFDPVRLRGLEEIPFAPQLRAFVRKSTLQWDFGLAVQRDLGGTDGLTADLSVSRRFLVGGGFLSVGPTLSFADANFARGFFGVSPTEAARGSRAAYRPDAGPYEVSLGGAFVKPLGRKWVANAAVGLGHLIGDAANSPVVGRKLAPRGAFGIAYRFK
jgi:outer membrane scaffolding protein for murein synthesis (MipA/OmpV family)